MFVLKKVLGGLAMPLPMLLMLSVVAWLISLRGYQRAARVLIFVVLTLLYLISIDPVANGLAASLEHAHPAYKGQPVEAIVVMGGGHISDERKPITSLLQPASMVRLSEGIRVYHLNPGSKLYLSGYGRDGDISQAEAMARVAQAMGVPQQDIVTDAAPKDSDDEAAAWSERLKNQQVALVTSAMHMPRVMYLFGRYGMSPIPAPTNYLGGPTQLTHWRTWLPNAKALRSVEAAWHEYLGIWWARLMAT